MKTPIKILAEKLRLDASATECLEGSCRYDREKFIGWCFRTGTTLTLDEVAALRWEHIQGSTVRGPIGLRGTITEATIVQPVCDALEEFRRPSGPIFRFIEWQKTLRYFRRTY